MRREEDQVSSGREAAFLGEGLGDIWKGFALWCLQTQGKEAMADSLTNRLWGPELVDASTPLLN